MADYTIPAIPIQFKPEGPQQPIVCRWTLAADGQVSGTGKVAGILPAGAMIDATKSRFSVDTAFNGTTAAFNVFLVPISTFSALPASLTADATATITNTVIAPGTTGIKYGTAAEVKTAGRNARLSVPCAVVLVYTAGAADATTGDGTLVIEYAHDLNTAIV